MDIKLISFKKYKKRNCFYCLISFLILLITYTVLIYLDTTINRIKEDEIITHEQKIIELENEIIKDNISSILGELHFLEDSFDEYERKNISFESLKNLWLSFSETSKMYDQIRFLDKSGQELIRINYNNGNPYVTPEDELQNKAHRYYFYEAKKMKRNEHFISQLDLNIENNEIELPIKPMIRFATNLYGKNNEFDGVIITNYLAEELLSTLKAVGANSYGEFYLLNSNGFWIAGGTKDRNWAFMYDEKKNINFRNFYPDEWNNILNGKKTFITDNGIFNWKQITVEDTIHKEVHDNLILREGNYYLLTKVTSENILGYHLKESFPKKLIRITKERKTIILLVILVILLSQLAVYIIEKSYKKIRYIADHDSLTGALNRRAGIEMFNLLLTDKKNRKRDKISICFIDINGLKSVNDVLGHEFGDELIVTVADIIKTVIRDEDFLIRLGGDEFLIIFKGIGSPLAEKVWLRILNEMETINKKENRKYIISASHGIVDNSTEMDEIIKLADQKMYEEKSKIKSSGFNALK